MQANKALQFVASLLATIMLAAEADEAMPLLSLRNAIASWGEATAQMSGAPWVAGTDPCNATTGNSSSTWKGVTCAGGQVVGLDLSGLGLLGTLPTLSGLSSLRQLDLSGNLLYGSLPPGWADELPSLASLRLQGNNLSGTIPRPSWTDGGFAEPERVTFEARPGNEGLCGPVVPISPSILGNSTTTRSGAAAAAAAGAAMDTVTEANLLHTGLETTSLVVTQNDLFAANSSVTIVNWLGSCMTPCSSLANASMPPAAVTAAGLSWPPIIMTNIFDISWVYNMSLADLVNLNPGVSTSRAGDSIAVPCYPGVGSSDLFGYYGGDMAYGQFAGGNQLAGPEGLAGAAAAAAVVGTWPVDHSTGPEWYQGSLGAGGVLVEPIFWFVDMQAAFQVSVLLLTAGDVAMTNASVYVGSDASSPLANTLVASGIDVAPGATVAVAANGVQGRYVIVYTGMRSEGTMSLLSAEVYTFESNSAPNMPITASYLSSIDRGAAAKFYDVLVDNNVSSCVQLNPDSSSGNHTAWAFFDLGYYGQIGATAVKAGLNTKPGTLSRVYVTNTAAETPNEADACSTAWDALGPGAWVVGQCNITGRFITLSVTMPLGNDTVDLCEIQVWLTDRPSASASRTGASTSPTSGAGGSSGLGGGAIAGIVVGALVGVALALIVGLYLVWRRRYLQQQRKLDALLGKGEDSPEEAAATAMSMENGTAGSLQSGLSGNGSRSGYGSAMRGSSAGHGSASGSSAAGAAAAGGKAAAVAAVPAVPATPPRPHPSEWHLLAAFFAALRHKSRSLSTHATHERMSFGPSVFPVVKGLERIDSAAVATDFSKLQPALEEVAPEEIQLIELVGEGSFGEVWLAMYCGAFVAVKIIAKVKSDHLTQSMQTQIAVRNLRKEALLMSKLRHPNVCLYLGACMDPPCLLFEYCAKSSLDRVLRTALGKPALAAKLTWVRLLSMALDAAKGMLYLHTRVPPIAHRDLKSANLLVDSQWRVKVADFSLSRAMETGSKAAMMTVMTTNPRWLPPEVLGGLPGQLPADVWAFGCVLWELCTWRLPYEELDNTFQIIALVQSRGAEGLEIPSPSELPAGPFFQYPDYVELMTACWAREAESRPRFDAIVAQLGAILTAEVKAQQQQLTAATGQLPTTEHDMRSWP